MVYARYFENVLTMFIKSQLKIVQEIILMVDVFQDCYCGCIYVDNCDA